MALLGIGTLAGARLEPAAPQLVQQQEAPVQPLWEAQVAAAAAQAGAQPAEAVAGGSPGAAAALAAVAAPVVVAAQTLREGPQALLQQVRLAAGTTDLPSQSPAGSAPAAEELPAKESQAAAKGLAAAAAALTEAGARTEAEAQVTPPILPASAAGWSSEENRLARRASRLQEAVVPSPLRDGCALGPWPSLAGRGRRQSCLAGPGPALRAEPRPEGPPRRQRPAGPLTVAEDPRAPRDSTSRGL